MSRLLVTQYYTEVERIIQYSGCRNEASIRFAFHKLLNEYCKTKNFELVAEKRYKTTKIRPDGTVLDAIQQEYGYWEAKDQYDDLDKEIDKKLAKGYPDENIIFENSQTAVLIQNSQETRRIDMKDASGLDGLIKEFINYVPPEVTNFYQAINSFKDNLPTILEDLRNLIAKQSETNQQFIGARDKFLGICQQSINPEISLLDVREMIIQHILSEDIFINIFNDSQFHQENNIASELQNVINTFFTGKTKRNTFARINSYYEVIKRTAVNIGNHHEKQKFLKAVYENFYKAYNPKAADRLGIVYTPNEIVRFMVESTDYLTHKHFGKLLADSGVEILDPATGTGTFITELIEYLPENTLKHKYQNEIHCNEVAILPYYIANLNIEYTYKQKMREYEEFDNICFVDTLDHTYYKYKQGKLFDIVDNEFYLSAENTERVDKQNNKYISVIIGNPPYNAKQENFNDNNANRSYGQIDKRIKDTYIKQGTAQNQIVIYDMYTRFIRWASDRIEEGVICFITNSSFIDKRTFDGFRKVVADEFSDIYIVDLGGNVRDNPKLSGTTHNVFGIQAGVAICFLVKKNNKNNIPCKIFYSRRPEFDTAKDKLQFIGSTKFKEVDFLHIIPDKHNNWINQTNNDFDELIPLIDKDVKAGKSKKAIFKLFSSGVKTQRDEWVYDFSRDNLEDKMRFAIDIYQQTLNNKDYQGKDQIKWDRELTKYLSKQISKDFLDSQIIKNTYRPYISKHLYFDKHFNGMTYKWVDIFDKNDNHNKYIVIPGLNSPKIFFNLASKYIIDLNCLPAGCQCLSLYSYDNEVNRIENITDWGLKQFQNYYKDKAITKQEIFHYVYAVLHNPEIST